MDFSRDGKKLAAGYNDSSIVIFDTKTNSELCNFYVRDASTQDVKFSPDNAILATAHYNNSIYLWDSETAKQIAVLRGHKGSLSSLKFSPDGTILASGGVDRQIILWSARESKMLFPQKTVPPKKEEPVDFSDQPELTAFDGKENLVKNPSANYISKFWKSTGETKIKKDEKNNPCFSVRYGGSYYQDVPIRNLTGSFALLISWSSSDRVNTKRDITGLPYLYGYWVDANNKNKFIGYLQGQKMLHSLNEIDEWGVIWGVFKVPGNTGAIRLFLNQASGKSSQTGSYAKFDDVGVFIFDSKAEAKEFAKKFEFD